MHSKEMKPPTKNELKRILNEFEQQLHETVHIAFASNNLESEQFESLTEIQAFIFLTIILDLFNAIDISNRKTNGELLLRLFGTFMNLNRSAIMTSKIVQSGKKRS